MIIPKWGLTGPQNFSKWLLVISEHPPHIFLAQGSQQSSFAFPSFFDSHISKPLREASLLPLSCTILPNVHCYGCCILIFSEHPLLRLPGVWKWPPCFGPEAVFSYSEYQNISSWLSTGSIIITGVISNRNEGFLQLYTSFLFSRTSSIYIFFFLNEHAQKEHNAYMW